MTTLIYHYDGQGLFTTQTEATMSPLEPDVPLVPSNATLVAPMVLTEPYTIQQFVLGFWSIISDYRGYHYFTPVGGEAVIEDVGVTPPAEAVELSDDDHLMQNAEGDWQLMTAEDDLDAYKKDKISSLKNSFSLELKEDGMNSSALGTDHKYDAEQHNIDWVLACSSLVLGDDSATPLITCDDLLENEDSKRPIPHDQGQCEDLLLHCITLIQGMKDKLAALEADVDNAVDEAGVDLVVWD